MYGMSDGFEPMFKVLVALAAIGIIAGLAWVVVGLIWVINHVRVVVL